MQTTTTKKKERKIYRSFGLPESLMIFVETQAEEQNESVNEIIKRAVANYKQALEV